MYEDSNAQLTEYVSVSSDECCNGRVSVQFRPILRCFASIVMTQLLLSVVFSSCGMPGYALGSSVSVFFQALVEYVAGRASSHAV